MIGRTANEKKGTSWDENAIDQAFEEVLDTVGWLLDQVMVTGCQTLFEEVPPLKTFMRFIAKMESELLIQWKIKQERGLADLFNRQNEWLHQELRSPTSFFSDWNSLRVQVSRFGEESGTVLAADPWKHLLLSVISNAAFMKDFYSNERQEQPLEILTRVCAVFEKLHGICPHHLALSFLNLVEIGTKRRPELSVLGTLLVATNQKNACPASQQMITLLGEEKGWSELPTFLLKFWKNH